MLIIAVLVLGIVCFVAVVSIWHIAKCLVDLEKRVAKLEAEEEQDSEHVHKTMWG